VCIERNKISLNEIEFDNIVDLIKPILKTRPCSIAELVNTADPVDEDKVIRTVQWLVDNEKILVDEERKYRWRW